MEETKTTSAETSLDFWAECPYCEDYQQIDDDIKYSIDSDLRAEDIEEHVTCSNKECGKVFIVDTVTY